MVVQNHTKLDVQIVEGLQQPFPTEKKPVKMQKTFAILLIFCSIYLTKSEDLFVEEPGETDFVPMESEPEIWSKRHTSHNYDYDENFDGENVKYLF